MNLLKRQESLFNIENGMTPLLEPLPPPSGDALLKAAWLGRLKLTRLLVEGGSDVNATDEYGYTVLMVSILSSYTDQQTIDRETLARFLLVQGANPNGVDRHGKTALIHVIQNKLNVKYVHLLLEFGSDPHLEDYFGSGALKYAAQIGNAEILTIIANACKHHHGKDVIIIVAKQSNEDPEENVKRKSNLTLPPIVPVNSVGIGSPEPRPHTFRESEHLETGNLSLKVSGLDDDKSEHSDDSSSDRARSVSPARARSCSGEVEQIHLPMITEPHKPSGQKKHPHSKLVRRNTENTMNLKTKKVPKSKPRFDANDLETMKLSLLKWEKEISESFHLDMHDPVLPKTMLPGEENALLAKRQQNDTCNFGRMGKVLDEVLIEEEIIDLQSKDRYPRDSRHTRKSMIGPGGRVLERQGSATKLLDVISHTRPGKLPPLNVNLQPPIPDIGSKPKPFHRSESALMQIQESLIQETEDSQADTFDDKPSTTHKMLLQKNPKRKLFKRSNTLQMCDVSKLVASNSNQETDKSAKSSGSVFSELV